AAGAFPLAHFYGRKSADAVPLQRARWHALLSSAESHSGAGIHAYAGRRRPAPIDPDYFSPFALVGRTGESPWREDAARSRSADRRCWIRALHHSGRGWQLLEEFLSGRRRAGHRDGGERGATHDDSDELG